MALSVIFDYIKVEKINEQSNLSIEEAVQKLALLDDEFSRRYVVDVLRSHHHSIYRVCLSNLTKQDLIFKYQNNAKNEVLVQEKIIFKSQWLSETEGSSFF